MTDGWMDVATAGATCVRASRPLQFLVHPLELHFEFTAGEILSAAPSFETRLSSCLHALLFLHPNSATCLCSCLWLSGSHTYTHTELTAAASCSAPSWLWSPQLPDHDKQTPSVLRLLRPGHSPGRRAGFFFYLFIYFLSCSVRLPQEATCLYRDKAAAAATNFPLD